MIVGGTVLKFCPVYLVLISAEAMLYYSQRGGGTVVKGTYVYGGYKTNPGGTVAPMVQGPGHAIWSCKIWNHIAPP